MDVTLVGMLFDLIRIILRLLSVVLIVYVVISWLYAFDVVSRRNAFVEAIWQFVRRISDPLLRPLRRIIPAIGGVDLSVLVLLLIIWFAERMTWWLQAGGPIL
jgi:YggT family protein